MQHIIAQMQYKQIMELAKTNSGIAFVCWEIDKSTSKALKELTERIHNDIDTLFVNNLSNDQEIENENEYHLSRELKKNKRSQKKKKRDADRKPKCKYTGKYKRYTGVNWGDNTGNNESILWLDRWVGAGVECRDAKSPTVFRESLQDIERDEWESLEHDLSELAENDMIYDEWDYDYPENTNQYLNDNWDEHDDFYREYPHFIL